MKVGLGFIGQIRALQGGTWIADTIQQAVAAITTSYHVEHTADDQHGTIHGLSLTLSAQPRCIAYHNTTQSIPSATYTALLLNSHDVAIPPMHDTLTNSSRVVIPPGMDGTYFLLARTAWASAAGNLRLLALYKNGLELSDTTVPPIGGGLQTQQITATLALLVGGDYIEMVGYQDSGGPITAGSATRIYGSTLSVIKVC